MTASDVDIIVGAVSARISDVITANDRGHADLQGFIHDVEARLAKKITDLCGRLAKAEEREAQCRADMETAIAAAKQEATAAAIGEATKPSVYRQAFVGMGRFTLKVFAVAAAIGSVVVIAITILEKTGIIGG